jgi:hypothetical protein
LIRSIGGECFANGCKRGLVKPSRWCRCGQSSNAIAAASGIDYSVVRWTIKIMANESAKLPKGEFVFPSPLSKPNKQYQWFRNALKESCLAPMGYAHIDPHGFRSTFADWCAAETSFAWDLREAQLAHIVGNKVERSYLRGDLLDKRRELLEAWANYCDGISNVNVLPMRRSAKI